MTRKRKTADVVFQGLEAGLRMFRWVVVILLVLFVFSGITKIEPDSVGLLLRFGKLQGGSPGEQVRQPGLLLAMPFPIDEMRRVPGKDKESEVVIDEVWSELTPSGQATTDTIDPVLEGYCLTGDHNIFQAKLVVKYRVSDPVAFELWMDKEDREALLRDVVLAALVHTVAGWTMDDALRLGRSDAETEQAPDAETEQAPDPETEQAPDPETEQAPDPETEQAPNPETEQAPNPETAEMSDPATADTTELDPQATTEERLAQTVWSRAQERLDALAVQTVAGWTMDDALRLGRSDAETEQAPNPETAEMSDRATADTTDLEPQATTEERLAQTVWRRAQERLDALGARGESKGCGMTISALEFQQRHPPRHVIAEFAAVQNAKIHKQTDMQDAIAFQNREIPNAETKANDMKQDARAQRDAMIAKANADVSEFQQLYGQYQQSPGLVWQRIYQETIEYVLGNVKKHLFVSPGTRVIIGENEDKGESQP